MPGCSATVAPAHRSACPRSEPHRVHHVDRLRLAGRQVAAVGIEEQDVDNLRIEWRTADVDAADAEQYDIGARLRDTDTPERELMRQEMEATVMKAVDGLPEELRTAITLREVEGLSYEEIAQKMDCPIGTVRSRIFRAREAIATRLRPMLDARQGERW